MRSWSFSVFAAFAVPVSSLHIYLASLERQSFLVCDGIQTLALVMRWSFSVFAVPASRLHIYLASMERQSFLVCDGIQTLDMLSIGLGSKKDRFSSSRPISDSCASSLSIFTVCARQQPPNALVISVFAVPASRLHIYLASMGRQSFLVCDGIQHWTCSL